MRYEEAMAALASGAAVDVRAFSASSGGGGGSPTTARQPGVNPDAGRQPRPQNG